MQQQLNKRTFENKNIQERLKAMRKEYTLLNVQSKEQEKFIKIHQIESLEAKLLITHENLNLAQVEKERME